MSWRGIILLRRCLYDACKLFAFNFVAHANVTFSSRYKNLFATSNSLRYALFARSRESSIFSFSAVSMYIHMPMHALNCRKLFVSRALCRRPYYVSLTYVTRKIILEKIIKMRVYIQRNKQKYILKFIDFSRIYAFTERERKNICI